MNHLLLDPATIIDWLKLPAWRAREAAALFSGINPDATKNIEQNHPDIWQKYIAMKRLFQRSVIIEFIDDYDNPQEWLSLALRFNIEIDSAVSAAFQKYKKPINYRRKYRIQKKKNNILQDSIRAPRPKRKNSYLRLIYGTVENIFPGWKNGNVTDSVMSILDLAACGLDRKTVKSILDEAKKEVDLSKK